MGGVLVHPGQRSPRPLAVVFAQVGPRRVLWPGVGVLAHLRSKAATWASVSGSKLFNKGPRRYNLLGYDYFKDSPFRALPPALRANTWIMINWLVRFVSYDDGSVPEITANKAWRLSDNLLQFFQTTLE